MRSSLCYILFLVSLLRLAVAGFVESYSLVAGNKQSRVLLPFIIYVAIDTDNKVMKFLINSQVQNRTNLSSTDVIITDVDPETNRYTTLNVKMDFMGKTFILENLRFCDCVAVKNTSRFGDSPRYDGEISTTTVVPTASELPENQNPFHLGSNKTVRAKREKHPKPPTRPPTAMNFTGPEFDSLYFESIATSNKSIDTFFANSTGNLTQCPLYQNDSFVLYYEADISENFGKLGSYSFVFTVVSNDNTSDIVGGSVCYVTSTVGSHNLRKLVFYGVSTVCLATYIINFFIVVLSPDQESSNPFLIEASTICNERLLRQLDADPTKLLNYLQYIVFLSGLNLQYPGFFLSAINEIKWCILLNINVISWKHPSKTENDHVFVTYHNSGLSSLTLSNSNGYIAHSWPNCMLCLTLWVAFTVVGYQLFITVKVLARRRSGSFLGLFGLQSSGYIFRHFSTKKHLVFAQDSSSSDSNSDHDFIDSRDTSFHVHPAYKPVSDSHTSLFPFSLSINGWAILGQILRQCILTFGFPFLVLTLHLLIRASGDDSVFYNYKQYFLTLNAFNPTVPYQLLQPWKFLLPDYYPNELTSALPEMPHPPSVKGPIAAGAITLILWFFAVLFFVCYYFLPKPFRKNKKSNAIKLYTSVKSIVIWVHMYNVYKPSKLWFVLADLFFLVAELFVIALLQSNGLVQVILLNILEFINYGLKVGFRPYYLPYTWYGLNHVILLARLLTTLLSITYIRELRLSEYCRSCIAFTQLSVHLVVGIYYILYVIFCFAMTAKAAMKAIRSKKALLNERNAPGDDGVEEFEFRQVPAPLARVRESTRSDFSPTTQSSVNDVEVDYYRAQSEKHLLNMDHIAGDHSEPHERGLDDESFFIQQAEKRIQKTDYTIREADKIYRKYFLSNEMDPEMRELWERRNWATSGKKQPAKAKSLANSWMSMLKSKFVREQPQGFEVVNRRPLVVHTIAQDGTELPAAVPSRESSQSSHSFESELA